MNNYRLILAVITIFCAVCINAQSVGSSSAAAIEVFLDPSGTTQLTNSELNRDTTWYKLNLAGKNCNVELKLV